MSNQPENTSEQGGCLTAVKGIVAIFVIGGIIGTCFFEEEKEVETAVEKEAKQREEDTRELKRELSQEQEQNNQVFSFTVNEFVSRYNQSTQNITRNLPKDQVTEKLRRRITVEESRGITDGVEHVLIQSGRGSNLYLSVSTNKNSNVVRSIYYMIYIPEKTDALVGDMLLGFTAIIMAVEDQSMPPAERGKRLKEIGTFKFVEDMRTIRTRKNNVDYKVDVVKAIGAITLSVKPSLP